MTEPPKSQGLTPLRKPQWNVRNVMSWGVFIGPAVLYGYGTLFGPPEGVAEVDPMAYLVGGAIGGALVFTAIAVIRNVLAK